MDEGEFTYLETQCPKSELVFWAFILTPIDVSEKQIEYRFIYYI